MFEIEQWMQRKGTNDMNEDNKQHAKLFGD